MKKLVTVCWSCTIEVNLPEGIGVDELEDLGQSEEIQNLASNIVRDASNNISWKDGVITDVQDIPDDIPALSD